MIIAQSETKKYIILPHIFAVHGIVCSTNSQDSRDEDSTKSGMSQDATP